jgi:hypothetical protein
MFCVGSNGVPFKISVCDQMRQHVAHRQEVGQLPAVAIVFLDESLRWSEGVLVGVSERGRSVMCCRRSVRTHPRHGERKSARE